jgi:hypothetical protein
MFARSDNAEMISAFFVCKSAGYESTTLSKKTL